MCFVNKDRLDRTGLMHNNLQVNEIKPLFRKIGILDKDDSFVGKIVEEALCEANIQHSNVWFALHVR